MRSRLTVVLALLAVLAGLGGVAPSDTHAAPARWPRSLTGPHPCAGQIGFTCSALTVPLDHSGGTPGHLKLQVATAGNAGAPKGVLLFLTGGPGQPGVPYVSRLAQRLADLMPQYRLVMLDQRGTGEFGAINCPQLQAQTGSSDIAVPTPGAVRECEEIVEARRPFYTTDQTVGDLEALREALDVRKMTVDGVSYGSFTAARYALGHPDRVNKLVLDSVVPHVDPQEDDALYVTSLRAHTRVLRDSCAVAPACGFDPAADLAWVVRHRSDQVRIFDLFVSYEFVDATYRDPNPSGMPAGSGDIIGAVHAARHGAPARLNRLMDLLASGGDPVDSFSSGLHAATVCTDMRFPWGDSSAPAGGRAAAIERARRALSASATWPYLPEAAMGNGFIETCRLWPSTRPGSEPRSLRLPPVPTLLLNGDRDLSTPLEWAVEEAGYAPRSKLVVVKGASHSVQNRETGTAGRQAVYAFLKG
ncbi:MAG: esterase/lipase-like protein [Streptosporangiaceae bacterium]|jgi:pimeloyl-ACP methyl ester carboxylesterase|nr:esterase/lipase-like protein [Streptosporangiaceae bacterium]